MSLVIVGSTALVVGGSVWDADLSQRVEGAMQAFLQEEAPITPRRMIAVALSLLLLATELVLFAILSANSALFAMVLLDSLVLVAVWRLAPLHLHDLVE